MNDSRVGGDFGYWSKKPCEVCGKLDLSNQEEPRFGYTVCYAHQPVPPAYIDIAKKEYTWFGRTIWDRELAVFQRNQKND